LITWFKEHVIIGVVGAAMGVVLVGWLSGLFNAFLNDVAPSAADVACGLKEPLGFSWPFSYGAADPQKFRVVIARLQADDADETQRHYVARILAHQPAIDLRSTCHLFRLSDYESPTSTVEQGRKLLERQRADLLIWGRVLTKDKSFELWFTSTGTDPNFNMLPFSLNEGRLAEFPESVAAQLEGVVLAAIAPATAQAGRYLVNMLRPVVTRLKKLKASPPVDFSKEQAGGLNYALGLVLQTIGNQTGATEPVADAIIAYREALQSLTGNEQRSNRAVIQNRLGLALETLDLHEGGTARLTQALDAYHEALAVYTGQNAPLDWARVQHNIGTVLQLFGEREHSWARLEQAAGAYREVLKEVTVELNPNEWGTAQNSLGTVLSSMGDFEHNVRRYEDSVSAFKEALNARKRDREPLLWALTQYNLGVTLRKLGDQEKDKPEYYEAAAKAFREALQEYSRERMPLSWAKAQVGLATAYSGMGIRTSGTAQLTLAVETFRAALSEDALLRAPFDSAMAQNNLGIALTVRGMREPGTASFEQAVTAFKKALAALEQSGQTGPESNVRGGLNWAEGLLEKRQRGEQ
jgi:tetratricopeptide (TPR) repeat protein